LNVLSRPKRLNKSLCSEQYCARYSKMTGLACHFLFWVL
jgi:hypothetical protein